MQLELHELGHRFDGGGWLFRGLDTVLDPGHVYALTGPSGSGKSTLLALLASWISPKEGTVERIGAGNVGWVFQNPHGTPRRTAIDHVALPLLARGMSSQEAAGAAHELLARFGLDDAADRQFRRLSGGEAQRLVLARGVAAQPGLLLIDEPTAQLDPLTTDQVNTAIAHAVTDATVIVVATHDPKTRDACTDHIDLAQYRTTSSTR